MVAMILEGADLLLPGPGGVRLRAGMALRVEGGRIAAIAERETLATDGRIDLGGGILAPGLVDLQVNGGGGVLLNDDPAVRGVEAIAAAHVRLGTTSLLPTLITDTPEVMGRAITAVRDAMTAGVPGVAGIHLEGPSLGTGRPGVHRSALFRTLDQDMVDLMSSLGAGRTLVTLAPEAAPPGAIAALVRRGVTVSLGHSDADFATVRRALAEGASLFTHLFNAMSPLTGREPGMVGAALEDPSAGAGLILDGAHVHPATARIALRILGPERLFLVSDAMPGVGTRLARFDLMGQEVLVRGDSCWTPEGRLAGANFPLSLAVRRAVELLGTSPATAIQLASATPADRIGMEAGVLKVGAPADLVHFDATLKVRTVWQAGRQPG
jgi:N-acetylglucosamine-6-phosphate deacetylase